MERACAEKGTDREPVGAHSSVGECVGGAGAAEAGAHPPRLVLDWEKVLDLTPAEDAAADECARAE